MKVKEEIISLIHLTHQKDKNILYNYFKRGNIARLARHFNTTPYMLNKHCKLLLKVGYAQKEGDNLRIYSIQHIIHSLGYDNPDRKLLRILRGVFKISLSGTMKNLSFKEVKLKIYTYLIHNNYRQQDWNNLNSRKPFKRKTNLMIGYKKTIEAGIVYSSVKMFAKYFEIPLSTMSRLITDAGKLKYLVKIAEWHDGSLNGGWKLHIKDINGNIEVKTFYGLKFKVYVY